MYYPPKFDCALAIELGELVKAAYAQFEAYKHNPQQPWTLPAPYQMLCPIIYRTFLSFDVTEDNSETAIDREMQQEAPVSFGLGDALWQNVPLGFVAVKEKKAYLIFRGTVTPREWAFDANIRMVPYCWQSGWGQVSDGFLKIYNRSRDSFMKKLADLGSSYQLFISGHSLGSALTLMALPDVVATTPFKAPTLYNFASPRAGDNDFVQAYNALPGVQTFRIVNTSDLVPSIPLPVPIPLVPSGYYSHVDTPVDFTQQLDDLALNHSMDTYLAALRA